MDVEEHYAMLLGINSPWQIAKIDLKLEQQQVDIHIEYTANDGVCPECSAICPRMMIGNRERGDILIPYNLQRNFIASFQ